MSAPLDPSEQKRLEGLYEGLRIRLLDLSRKNQLLNYNLRPRSKRSIQVIGCSLEDAHRRLAIDEATLKVSALPHPDAIPADERTEEFCAALDRAKSIDVEYLTALEALESNGRDDDAVLEKLERELRDRVREELELPRRPTRKDLNRAEHARSLGIDPSLDLDPKNAVRNGKGLQTLKFPDELEAVMEKIYGDAGLAEQEMGLSTLFLAFGFLEWYESDSSDKKSFAPLLLLPVQIERQKVQGKPDYSLTVREGNAEANLSLQKLLEQRFGRQIPDFGSEDEEDDSVSVEGYVDQVTKAIEGLKRWQVKRWLVLGHFSFGRFAMYQDLEPENWKNHVAHPLVGSILKGTEDGDGDSLPGIPDDYEIDSPEVEKIAPYLIQDADASQHSALVDVMKGKNLVVQGPPGTGKSQTITNVIANALAAGKRVLFLAEKQAALEVVKRRLDRSEVGDFCLELHSDKSSPKSVISSIQARYEAGVGRLAAATPMVDVAWVRSKQEITSYVRALHAELEDGSTPFALIWDTLRKRTNFSDLMAALKDVQINQGLLADHARLAEIKADLAVYAGMASSFAATFGHPAQSPWAKLPFSDFPPYDASRFVDALKALGASALATREAIARYAGIGVRDVDSFLAAVDLAEKLPELPDFDLAAIADLDVDDFVKGLSLRADLLKTEEELQALPDLRHEDPEKLAIAAAHMRSADSAEFLERPPAEAYELADGEIEALKVFAEAVEAVIPVLKILGLGTEIPATHLPAATSASYVLGMSPARVRRWIVELPDASVEAVSAAIRRRTELLEAETEWAAKIPAYPLNARPEPSDLFAAVETLRKSGFGKLAASLGGKMRAARALAANLGTDPKPDRLEALAEHVAAVRAFEANETLATLFGPAWAGLGTPMEDVKEGLQLRDLILRVAQPHPGADQVIERAMAMTPDDMTGLSPHNEACKRVFSLPTEDRARFEGHRAEKLAAALRRCVAKLEAFLAVDPNRWLAEVDAPIRRIAHAHAVLGRVKRIRQTLGTHPTAIVASMVGTSPGAIETAKRAAEWVRVVKAAALREDVAQALLSERATPTYDEFRRAAEEWKSIEAAGDAALVALTEFGAQHACDIPPDKLIPLVNNLVQRGDELADFVSLRQIRGRLEAEGIAGVLAACDKLAVEPDRLPEVFAALLTERKAASARRSEALRSANGAALEAYRRAFRERDREKIEKDRKAIRAKLLEPTPPIGSNYGPKKTWTDMRLLLNEFGKQRRFTPVRQLLSRAGRAVQTLKPCFMMSPLSLAKFVPARSLSFDLLVIDEASQMRPEDSLGGLLRASQIVVVGDARQLPPTDFFSRGEAQDGADEEMDDVDAESILEACDRTFGERRRLKWHYRSRCESLIAFSNREFYDNTLITFPMARPGSFSVELVRVDGVYRAQSNSAEAQRVVEEAIRFMRHFAEATDDELPTLGIVAVNIQQRDFILEELRRASADDEFVDKYRERVEAKGEPLFVKNLENVQGDERDHVFISMTYGKKHGEPSLSQNFGPINRKQGHRRLNVLFTRARVRIGLFTSFGSADVRVEEKSSEGVRALKAYLEFAETKGRAVAHVATGTPDSDFETEVADRLRLRGYEVDLQVGLSRQEERGKSFRIDLAVWHPDHPEHYLAGVECDGAAYHSSKSARDRDRLREEVLESLGWQLVRVWSTDWFDNPSKETDKLVARLEQLRKRSVSAFASYPPFHQTKAVNDQGVVEEAVKTMSEDARTAGEPAFDGGKPTPALSRAELASDGRALLEDTGKLTPTQAIAALEAYRDTVIAPTSENWEAERSLLRPAMIETFIKQRIVDPDQWYTHVPQFLRQGTNGAEKKRYLEDVCALLERL